MANDSEDFATLDGEQLTPYLSGSIETRAYREATAAQDWLSKLIG